jgi:hypothetical protein
LAWERAEAYITAPDPRAAMRHSIPRTARELAQHDVLEGSRVQLIE